MADIMDALILASIAGNGGGGGGGATSYNQLTNRPKINGNLLTGDKSSDDLDLADAQDVIDLQEQIDALVSRADVVDVVATHAALEAYDTSLITENDVIKVLSDETRGGAIAYYRWVITGGTGAWTYVGVQGPFYTKSETDSMLSQKQGSIADLDDIRAGAGKGASSVQTVNGEEPDSDGNVNVSASEGQYIEPEGHTALANWGDFVFDEFYEAITFLDLYILGSSNPNDNKVIRCVIDVETDNTAESPISIVGDVEYTIMWANGTAPTFTADHTYEVVISKAPNNRLLCSWSEFGD